MRIRVCLLCGVFALSLFVPGFGHAEENPILDLSNTEAGNIQVPGSSCQEQQQVTLEQLEQIYGAKKMCAARCVSNPTTRYCTSVCGDAAGCVNGYCIYF